MRKLRAVHRSSVEVVRHDLKPLIMGLCRNIVEHGEENTQRLDEQDRLWKYDQVECVWYRAERVQDEPPRWRGETVSGLPERVPPIKVFANAEDSLELELRYRFAHEVMAARLVRDWDDARARAAKAKFLCGEVVT